MTPSETPIPTHPRAFGDELRRMREAAGVSLDDISTESKISRRVLDALEKGAFGYLPERVFSRNFVVQYAHLIGADAGRVAAAFDEAWERYLLASGSHPSLQVEEPPPRRTVRWGFWLPIVLGAVILTVVAVVIVRGSGGPEEGLPPDPRRSLAGRPSPTATAPAAPSPGVTSDPTPAASSTGETVEIAFEVDDARECWVYYRDRDGRTDQQLLVNGERLELSLAGPVTLTVGNGGAIAIEIGGRSYDDLGDYGEVVHARADAGGLQRLRDGWTDDG